MRLADAQSRPPRSDRRRHRAVAVEHDGRASHGGSGKFVDRLPRTGTALACTLLLMRTFASARSPRIGAEVFTPLLDGFGFSFIRDGARLRRDRKRCAGGAAAPAASPPLFAVGLGLMFVGLAFKLGLAPFHVWTPDVFEGAPLPVTAFMRVVTKAGAWRSLRVSSMRRCRARMQALCSCRSGSSPPSRSSSETSAPLRRPTSSVCSRTRVSRNSGISLRRLPVARRWDCGMRFFISSPIRS